MLKYITLVIALLSSLPTIAQDTLAKPVRTVVRPAYLPGMNNQQIRVYASARIMDSLHQAVTDLKNQNDSLLLLINDELSKAQSLEQQNIVLASENKKLSQQLGEARGEQLQTSHTSSILLVFNIMAGIILLIALIWIFTRKKIVTDEPEVPVRPMSVSNHIPADPVEIRLERIEKLGRLRDKGLLTEDEFQLQKKQLLG